MSGSMIPPMVPIPPQNSAFNHLIQDVIGNKTDTVAGNSLYARLLQAIAGIGAIAAPAVPAPDAAANVTPWDVIGQKGDSVAGDSLYAGILQTLARLVLPGADGVGNVTPADVIGQKGDSVAGDSLYALLLQAQARLVLPGADAAANVTPADVIGQKGDSVAGDSIYALLLQTLAAIAAIAPTATPSEQLIYPDVTGAFVNVPTGAVPPAYGAYVEIIPAATITNDFVITNILFDSAGWGAAGLYFIQLAYGAGDTFAGEVASERTAVGDLPRAINTLVIPANSRVRARTATVAGGGADNCGMRLFYREV